MKLTLFCVILVIVPLGVFCLSIVAPCSLEANQCPPGQRCETRWPPCAPPPCDPTPKCVDQPDKCQLSCPSGEECRLQEVTCVKSPCPPQQVCVPSTPYPNPKYCDVGKPIVDENSLEISCNIDEPRCPDNTTCQSISDSGTNGVCCQVPESPEPTGVCVGTNCPPGQRCAFLTLPCPPPPNCKPVAVCVPSESELTCPNVTNQVGTCAEECSSDDSCPGTQKCCSNGCGHTCQDPVPAPQFNPCIAALCPVRTECTPVDDPSCTSRPCKQVAKCLDPRTDCVPPCNSNEACRLTGDGFQPVCIPGASTTSQCPDSFPLVNANNMDIFCGRGPNRQDCPRGTFCNTHPLDLYAVCCLNTTDKPGTCPKDIGEGGRFGICVEECLVDDQCEGEKRCCNNGCGMVCVDPANKEDPCDKKCSRGFQCRMQVPRWRRGCRAQPACIRTDLIYGPKQASCPVGKPVVTKRNEVITCRKNGKCPRCTYRYHDVDSSKDVCCPGKRGQTQRPGRCPRPRFLRSYIFCRRRQCKKDDDCPPRTRCCRTRFCRKRCIGRLNYG